MAALYWFSQGQRHRHASGWSFRCRIWRYLVGDADKQIKRCLFLSQADIKFSIEPSRAHANRLKPAHDDRQQIKHLLQAQKPSPRRTVLCVFSCLLVAGAGFVQDPKVKSGFEVVARARQWKDTQVVAKFCFSHRWTGAALQYNISLRVDWLLEVRTARDTPTRGRHQNCSEKEMRMKFQKFATWMLILPVAISFATAGLSEASAKEKVRIGVAVSWPGYAFYELARAKDLAPAYDMEITIYEDPIAGHNQLAAGNIDVYVSTLDYIP
ncbi:MAG: hypothetical protein VX676_04525, partial [Pseudomonadota bacterium]|nr:hypothetical protein [Pseudomonadota bacterium]